MQASGLRPQLPRPWGNTEKLGAVPVSGRLITPAIAGGGWVRARLRARVFARAGQGAFAARRRFRLRASLLSGHLWRCAWRRSGRCIPQAAQSMAPCPLFSRVLFSVTWGGKRELRGGVRCAVFGASPPADDPQTTWLQRTAHGESAGGPVFARRRPADNLATRARSWGVGGRPERRLRRAGRPGPILCPCRSVR